MNSATLLGHLVSGTTELAPSRNARLSASVHKFMKRILVVALLLNIAFAEMIGPSSFPSVRILQNLKAKLAKTRTAETHYMLGRTYYALFCASDPRSLQLYGTATQPRFPNSHTSVWEFQNLKPKTDKATLTNIRSAIAHLQKANEMGGGEPGLYALTLACAFEASAKIAPKVEEGLTEAEFRRRAVRMYERAFRAAKDPDYAKGHPQQPMTYENWISVEAADALLRLNPSHPLKNEIVRFKEALSKLPPGPITPLIFSLSGDKSLGELLDPSCFVRFDLDGTGSRQRYSWVKPDTAFLVWQPDPRVPIRSGRSLFGSATFWLMPKDAYAAMALLDDDANGWLEGRELSGLAMWRDANQNGIAEAREVVSLAKTPVVGLRTSFDGFIGESMVSARGLRLADGRVLPTYDWVTQAISTGN